MTFKGLAPEVLVASSREGVPSYQRVIRARRALILPVRGIISSGQIMKRGPPPVGVDG